MNIGILSTSSIAPRFIAAVREEGSFQMTALSSRTLEKAEEKAKAWDIPKAYGSHEELLEDKDVDIVYISAVNAAHYKWAKAALLAGKHVICEKPCTTTEVQTRELFTLAKEKGRFVAVNVLEERNGKLQNSTYLYNKNGEITFVYDKIHLPPSEVALNDHIYKLRVQFYAPADPVRLAARDKSRTGAEERVEHDSVGHGGVAEGVAHQRYRLHRRMVL